MQLELYMTQMQYLDQQKDTEERQQKATEKKLEKFMATLGEKADACQAANDKHEERNRALEHVATELG